jgi:methylmalonyl-CoA mutase cobalamin-binding domain/chain
MAPIRILTAVPVCDGHDSAITTINLELSRNGIEVIYLGYHRTARDVVRAAVQEDVAAVGISSYNGGHVEFFRQVKSMLRRSGAGHIGVFGGGGGTISAADAAVMRRGGVERIFFPGEAPSEVVKFVKRRYGKIAYKSGGKADVALARRLSDAERGPSPRPSPGVRGEGARMPRVIGITGPGGAGKTTLIDELVFRLLRRSPRGRLAILSHDPSIVGRGAILGDRAAMIYAQDDRVFMRSLATRGRAGGVAAATGRCLTLLRNWPAQFDVIFVETVGIGQEALPFAHHAVDCRVLVMSPDYGARLQLQKIAMLDVADVVVLNKSDLIAAPAAAAEISQRLESNGRGQRLIGATAKRHGDGGVDQLLDVVAGAT